MAENETIKERLILFIRHLNIGQGKFETRCGLANGYVNNIRRSITPEKLQQIARQYPELNAGWLMTGEGEMLKSEAINIGTTGNINGNNNSGCVTVTQTIGDNSGQNAGRDINNPPCPNATLNMLNELKELRHLAEQQLQVYASSLDKKDEQIRAAHQHIDTLIRQNQEQFSRFMSLLEDSRHH